RQDQPDRGRAQHAARDLRIRGARREVNSRTRGFRQIAKYGISAWRQRITTVRSAPVNLYPRAPGEFTMEPDEATAVETVDFLVDFERAEVITPMIYPPRPRLVVSGVTAFPVDVSLVPLVYVSRPPFWGIQVVGSNPAAPQATPAITNVAYD